jgi:outer membrane protein OmpA-like peptidoglycan-associated protein
LNKANGVLDVQLSTQFQVNGKGQPDSFNFFKNMGLGADIGFVYEKRNGENYNYTMDCKDDNVRKDLNKYSFRIGISLIDFGYINWKGQAPIRRIFFDSSLIKTPVNKDLFNAYPDIQKGNGKILEQFANGFIIDTTPRIDYYMWTPTKLNAFMDFHLYKGLYLAMNGTYTFVNNNYASSLTQHMQFNFTPRIESKAFGFYLPVQYNGLAEEFNVGLGMRLFCMNIGLYDWTGFAGLKSQTKNAGFNFSLNIPIHHRAQPKDDDHDLMSNKMDKCKGTAGDCNSGGCPLPDDDEDGVDNTQDKCPNVKGPKSLDGCPDTDEDGIPDSKDRCPKKKGPRELGGCPDKDGDGIIDTEDKCPSDKGSKALDGCPDRDGDHIPDNIDECPTDSGVFENRGCPPVIIKDSDNDGVLDTADKCPNVAGPSSNKGCPMPVESISVAKMAQDKLEFHTGSAIIKPESIYSLTVLAEYLTKNPQFNLDLAGHTDNVGKEDKNLKLSIDRANAVKNFFVSKGISPSRITADGFGLKYPIADNRTFAGRAVNRRVDIEVK